MPFPYADKFAEKRRPALVVSSDEFNARHGLLWVAMITSAFNPRWTDDVVITQAGKAGLPASSMVRPAKIATIEPGRVVRIAGRIDGKTAAAVRRQLVEIVG